MIQDWHCGVPIAIPPLSFDDPPLARLAGWLTGPGRDLTGTDALFAGLLEQLLASGLPIWRSVILYSTLHPLHPGQNYFWLQDQGVSLIRRGHDFESSVIMTRSPYREALDRQTDIDYRLRPDATPGLPVLVEMQAQGVTEFLSFLIPFTYGPPPGITFATKAEGGFGERQIALLRALPPLLAAPLEVRAQRLTAAAVLDTYLGRRPGQEVLQGAIQRGDVRRTRCVILLTDLRGFTDKTERWRPESLLRALDHYFEAVADAVYAGGGEVMKFMGDGLLAIFPIEGDVTADRACPAAIDAVLEAQRSIGRINTERMVRGEEPLEFGAGLHLGEVAYGNIGSRDRLDFTVIGPAVNTASRVQDLCKSLGQPLLMTSEVARRLDVGAVSLGNHEIRGSAEPIEIFSLETIAAAAPAKDFLPR